MLKTFDYKACHECGLQYQPVDWLPWRRAGICSSDCFETFDERAAIREFDGGYSRKEAERLAMLDLGYQAPTQAGKRLESRQFKP